MSKTSKRLKKNDIVISAVTGNNWMQYTVVRASRDGKFVDVVPVVAKDLMYKNMRVSSFYKV